MFQLRRFLLGVFLSLIVSVGPKVYGQSNYTYSNDVIIPNLVDASDVCVDPTTANIFVVDATGNCIHVLSADYSYKYRIGSGTLPGSNLGEFNVPVSAAISNGKLYVTEYLNHRIQVFDTNTFIAERIILVDNINPYGIAISKAGQIVVSDAQGSALKVYKTDGTYVRQFSSNGVGVGQVLFPAKLVFDEDNNLFVADPNNNRISVFNSSYRPVNTIVVSFAVPFGGGSPYSIAFNKSGLLALDNSVGKVGLLSPFGEQINVFSFKINSPRCIAIDTNGQLIVSTFDKRLVVYKPDFGTTPPVTSLNVTPLENQLGWTQASTIELSAVDAFDDPVVKSITFQVDDALSNVLLGSSVSINIEADGVHTLKFFSEDVRGNKELTKSKTIKIDRTKPSTSATVSNGGLAVTLNATDATSGVKATYYSINGGPVQEYKDLIVVPVGNNPVTYWSVDNAGNREDPKVVTPEGSNNQASQITSFRIDKSSSLGGPSRSLTLEIKAQSTPTTITLGSDNVNVVVPSSITIDAGQTSKTFTIETKPVGAYTQTNITATLGTQTRTAQLDLFPPTARIRISPPVVSSESTAKATITLSGNAPTGGLRVDLESDETAASVPSSITVPEGQKTATFNIVAGKVTEETYAYITATIDGVSSEASLTIRPKSIKPTTLSITESLVGGANGTGTITLSDPAPEGGLDVDLATNNAAVSLPLVVKVPEGSKTASFTFSTSAVSNTITATVSAKANGATVTDTIEVKVRPLGTLVASPSTLPGKAAGTLTLTLSSPSATPLTVSITSSNAAVVLASKTITIAKGQSSGILKFTTALVGVDTTSTITCLSNGLEAKTDITVQSAKPSNLSLLPAVVLGGKGSVGTVTIDSAAPTSGLTVALSSSDSSAVVPSFVLVPSGKTSATFTITTSKVTSSKNVTITAQANGVSKTATLGVRILTIASISFNPVSVEGGVKANGLLTLTDVAPLGGMTVTLGSDKAGVTVPTSLLVPAGKSSVAFVASTSVTGSSYDAKVTGTANGETGSGSLKVLAPAVSSFALSLTNVKGGDKPLGTVKIAKASTVDVVVSLSSSNAAVASLPATVTIPRGQLLATFQVVTTKPSVSTSVTLSATTGGLAKVVVLKVSP